MNWEKTGYEYEISVIMVHQTDVNHVLGALSGVQLSGAFVKESYYSDSRVQAKIATVVGDGESDGYIPNARLRIILSIPSKQWSKELITGYVSDCNVSISNGRIKRTYTIESSIWGLLDHKISAPITIGKGSSLVSTWESVIKSLTKLQYVSSGSQDHMFGNTVLYEAGTVLSTVLFEISSGYDRMDVNGHGEVTLSKYTAPSKKEPSRVVLYNDPSGLLINEISVMDSSYEAPGRAIVTANVSKTSADGTSTTQEVIVGVYDAPAEHPTSIYSRGWLSGRTDVYSGVSDSPSKSELNAIAKANWEREQGKGKEWSVSTVFSGYFAGEVVNLIVPDSMIGRSVSHKVLISTVNTKLDSMTQELTMKET